MPDVFVSYSHKDKRIVFQLVEQLSRLGLDVWSDAGLDVGLNYTQQILQAASSAKAMVCVWSPSSVSSSWVFAEALFGLHFRSLVPVKIESADRFPTPFDSLHAIDLTNWEGRRLHEGWKQLINRLAVMCGRPEIEALNSAPLPPVACKGIVMAFDNYVLGSHPSLIGHLPSFVAQNDGAGSPQITEVFSHDRGVYEAFIGGSYPNHPLRLQRAFEALSRAYNAGDRIYIFGLGSGCSTARLFGAFLQLGGVLRPDRITAFRALLDLFERLPSEPVARVEQLLDIPDVKAFREENSIIDQREFSKADSFSPRCVYMGLWDAVLVEARALRFAGLARKATQSFNIHGQILLQGIEAARHARSQASFSPPKLLEFTDFNPRNASPQSRPFREMVFPSSIDDVFLRDIEIPDRAVSAVRWVLDGAFEAGLAPSAVFSSLEDRDNALKPSPGRLSLRYVPLRFASAKKETAPLDDHWEASPQLLTLFEQKPKWRSGLRRRLVKETLR